MIKRVVALSLLVSVSLAISNANKTQVEAVGVEQKALQESDKEYIQQRGLFLKRGVGISPWLQIRKNINLNDSMMLGEFEELFGLEAPVDTDGKIQLIKCSKPGCYTDNNVAVGDLIETVYGGFGKPLQSDFDKDTQERFLAYEGVAFLIGKDRRVKEIYILPLPPRK